MLCNTCSWWCRASNKGYIAEKRNEFLRYDKLDIVMRIELEEEYNYEESRRKDCRSKKKNS